MSLADSRALKDTWQRTHNTNTWFIFTAYTVKLHTSTKHAPAKV